MSITMVGLDTAKAVSHVHGVDEARAMGLARGTVRNHAHASSFPERAARRAGRSIIDPHLPYL